MVHTWFEIISTSEVSDSRIVRPTLVRAEVSGIPSPCRSAFDSIRWAIPAVTVLENSGILIRLPNG